MTIELWPDKIPYAVENKREDPPILTPYLTAPEQRSGGAVIICPGGGYTNRADHEGEPIAKWLNRLGISAFVLHYRVSPHRHPAPLADVQRAIRYVRYHADQWSIDSEKIGVLGFSAGGHLASTAGTHFDSGNSQADDPVERAGCRPSFMVLCYPVISFGAHRHQGSLDHLLGPQPSEELIQSLSNETRVTEDTPPTFLWHTADDDVVPAENSMLFAEALSRCKIPYELHIFESGKHGLGLAHGHEYAAGWTKLCEAWLRKRGL